MSENALPLISVVIVTWNRRADVLETVQSVYDQRYSNLEIIVVDNNSNDGTAEALATAYPAVRVIALDRNTGAVEGRNVGISAAAGEIAFILDSDASLLPDTLHEALAAFAAYPDAGIITCKIIDPSGQLDRWIYPEAIKANKDQDFLSYSFVECGAAIRTEAFRKVGPFWGFLFIDREGDELSLRLWDAGYSIVYWPRSVVCHREQVHAKIASGKRMYFDLRNSLAIYLVHYPWWMLLAIAPLKILSTLLRGLRHGTLPFLLRALADVGRNLPLILRQRRPIRGTTARRYLRMQREHGPFSWSLAGWLRYKF